MTSIGLSTQNGNFEFLQLLVAQLQNQDPIEPVKQEEFINQLTSFSTLEAVENLNVRFDELLQVQQLGQGFDLAGKNVRYVDQGQTHAGLVDEVSVIGGNLFATIDGNNVPISNIISILG